MDWELLVWIWSDNMIWFMDRDEVFRDKFRINNRDLFVIMESLNIVWCNVYCVEFLESFDMLFMWLVIVWGIL